MNGLRLCLYRPVVLLSVCVILLYVVLYCVRCVLLFVGMLVVFQLFGSMHVCV